MLESDWDKSIGPYVSVKETVMRNKLISTSKMQHRIYWLGMFRMTLVVVSHFLSDRPLHIVMVILQVWNSLKNQTHICHPQLSQLNYPINCFFYLYSCGHGIFDVKFMSIQNM
jgi:hypothetical protein